MTEQGAAGIDVIGQALAELDSAEILIVCPGLIHNGDDIGALHCGEGLRVHTNRLHQLLDVARGGVGGLLHLHELEVPQEGGEDAGGAVGTGLIPDIGADAEASQGAGIENGGKAEQCHQ